MSITLLCRRINIAFKLRVLLTTDHHFQSNLTLIDVIYQTVNCPSCISLCARKMRKKAIVFALITMFPFEKLFCVQLYFSGKYYYQTIKLKLMLMLKTVFLY